ncbi:MAG: hypothetical protein RLO01_01885 [Thalassobaculaceae bacterium]
MDGASSEAGDAPVEVLGDIVSQYEAETGQDVPEDDGETGAEPPPEQQGYIPKSAFIAMLAGMFGMTGGAVGLRTLHDASRRPTFVPAAEAFYDVCVDTPALRFLIEPESRQIHNYIAIGWFVTPLARECFMEMRALRAKPVNDNKPKPETAEASPDGPADDGDTPSAEAVAA